MNDVAHEIRAAQVESIANVERQLRSNALHIEIEGHLISREAAWAAVTAIRSCWRRGLRYDPQQRDVDGNWWAIGVHVESDAIEPECIGKFPAELARTGS